MSLYDWKKLGKFLKKDLYCDKIFEQLTKLEPCDLFMRVISSLETLDVNCLNLEINIFDCCNIQHTYRNLIHDHFLFVS
jgi:hypothetical protein